MFSFSRLRERPVLVADIGDGSVGVSLVMFGKEGPAEVIASKRVTLSIEERTRDQAAAGISQILETSVAALIAGDAQEKHGIRTPHAIYATLRAPWTRFRTAKTGESFDAPQTITKEIIVGLAKKALVGNSELDRGNMLEAGVMQVFLNGYPTGRPLGKRAKNISVVAFESDIDPNIRASVIGIFGKLLPGRTPILRSGMHALLTVMHEHLTDIHRCLLIDIGGSTSACAVVRKEAITQYATVPEGIMTILKRVSAGGLPEEMLSLLRMLATDSCSTSACDSLKDSLAKAEPELVRAFGEVFASLATARRLPNICVLTSPSELTPWLHSFFSRIDFSQFTATTQPLIVETVTSEHLSDAIHWKPGIVSDAGISIASSYVDLLERSA